MPRDLLDLLQLQYLEWLTTDKADRSALDLPPAAPSVEGFVHFARGFLELNPVVATCPSPNGRGLGVILRDRTTVPMAASDSPEPSQQAASWPVSGMSGGYGGPQTGQLPSTPSFPVTREEPKAK